MEEMELDAARVLAGFAQAARMERQGEAGGSSRGEAAGSSRGEPAVSGRGDDGGGGGSDGGGGGRGRKRRSSRGGASTPASSQGTRISLSADEKEAKRMRRILANRESARQTIRRRQAVRDELTKKVADLSMDNKKMKMEKELVMKEYMSLKDKNKQLKEQIANTIRSKVEGARVASQRVEVSESLSTELPLVVHRPPFVPYIWPSFPSSSPNSSPSYQEGFYPKTCGLKKLFHVPPYSWFYPLIHQLSGYCPPYPHVCSDRDEATRHKEREVSSCSQEMNDMDKTSLCRGSKSEVSVPIPVAAEKEINVVRTSARPSSFQRENQMPGSYPDGVLLAPSPLKILNPRYGDEGERVTDAGVRSHKHHLDPVMPDKQYEEYIHPHDKVVEMSAAAEARKRRKELTKLKRQQQRRQVPEIEISAFSY